MPVKCLSTLFFVESAPGMFSFGMVLDILCVRADVVGPTPKVCDACTAYLTSKLGPDFIKEVDMPTVLAFYANPDYTYEQKTKAMFEVCTFKLRKAMKALGVNTGKVNKVFKYPNGNAWKCSWDVKDYPVTMQMVTEYIQKLAGPLLGALAGN